MLFRSWLRHKAFKKEKDLWLLAGGSRLILYRADWQGDASLQDPNLSLSPAGPWVAQIVTNPEKKLELRSVSGAFKNTK